MVGLIVIAVIVILGLAAIGLVTSIGWLTSPATKHHQYTPSPKISDDFEASSRLLDYLFSTKQINAKTYHRIRDFLSTKVANQAIIGQPPSALVRSPTNHETTTIADLQQDVNSPSQTNVVAQAQIVERPGQHQATERPSVSNDRSPAQSVAPWDRPDPPARTRRSLSELMNGFMQEKNMRWGEVTSGILIVLSAIGLVISLREELQNTIPWFSALLFMLVTAAIQGAGVYTLKKWKLRNTSRGTLIIGLLLIPLNFVAACVLSFGEQRRELDDPWLWVGVSTGLVGFTALAWWSSKSLLRRGHWPMVMTIMGCGVGTIIVNRMVELGHSSLYVLMCAAPIAASFLIGTCTFETRQWTRNHWTDRSIGRLFLFLGISTFAALTALSLVIVRTEDGLRGVYAALPVVSLICVIGAWQGSIVRQNLHLKAKSNLRLIGFTIQILSLILMSISIVASIANPVVFVVNALVVSYGLFAISFHQRNLHLVPIAWAVLAGGLISGLNLAVGHFEYDRWTSLRELSGSIFNGQTGLTLFVMGCAVVGVHFSSARYLANSKRDRWLSTGGLTGGMILLSGCLSALVASFINPNDFFDSMAASALLMTTSIVTLGSCIRFPIALHRSFEKRTLLRHRPLIGSVLLFAGLSHASCWNPVVTQTLNSIFQQPVASWLAAITVGSLMISGLAFALNWQNGKQTSQFASVQTASKFSLYAAIANSVVIVGVFWIASAQTGWATVFSGLICLNWFLLATVWANKRERPTTAWFCSAPLVASSAVLVIVSIVELVSRFSWCPGIHEPRHYLIQAIGLAGWSVAWIIISHVCGQANRLSWLANRWRIEKGIHLILVAGIVSMVLKQLFDGVSSELFARFTPLDWLQMQGEFLWVYGAIATVAIALSISMFEKPTSNAGIALVYIWMTAWAFAATSFSESKSVATALRWLVPIGTFTGAILVTTCRPLIPSFSNLRDKLEFSRPVNWNRQATQQLINWSLGIATVTVLLISTANVCQVLFKQALGGPLDSSAFKVLSLEIRFGMPVVLIVSTFLWYSISERRPWLATAGSTVFQYLVLLMVVMLFIAPHPKLATQWFVNIVQTVSLGMTAYGFVWWLARDRIESHTNNRPSPVNNFFPQVFGYQHFSQLSVHATINGVLITCLSTLMLGRLFFVPDSPSGWVSSVGRMMGVAAWIFYAVFAIALWRKKIARPNNGLIWIWLTAWTGIVLTGLAAAAVEQSLNSGTYIPWLSFKIVVAGLLVTTLAQISVMTWQQTNSNSRVKLETNIRSTIELRNVWPLSVPALIGVSFATRGAIFDVASFWFYSAAIGLLGISVAVAGCLKRNVLMGFIANAILGIGVTIICWQDPEGWLTGNQPNWFNLMLVVQGIVAICWTAFYLWHRHRSKSPIARWFAMLPNFWLLLGSGWIFFASVLQVFFDFQIVAGASALSNPLGFAALVTTIGLFIVTLWNDRGRFRVIGGCLLSVSIGMCLASRWSTPGGWSISLVTLTISLIVALWGYGWSNRIAVFKFLKRLNITRIAALRNSIQKQLPVYSLIAVGVTMVSAVLMIFLIEPISQRAVAGLVPMGLAFGIGCQSNRSSRRWMQIVSLLAVVTGALLLAWSNLKPETMFGLPLLVRALVVLSGAMFIYGWLVPRWARPGDSWLKSLREMAVTVAGLAVLCLVVVLVQEAIQFQPGKGCGLSIAESGMASVLIVGMVVGLSSIAIRPENDPFALSLAGRMGYVYAAQAVTVMLVVHLYFSMPWLFQLGIKHYWPYIMMAICFVGVGLAGLLEKRNLIVLGQPIFNTAAALPLVVAVTIFVIDSRADASLVMLIAGFAYLLIGDSRQSILSTVVAIVFGNVALWLFYDKFEGISIFEHPQLWLIPPAVSGLIAGHLSRHQLPPKQRSTLRYLCIAVIYLSSTSDIFISGIGDNLWPPVILASLSVAGIMAGIIFNTKPTIYFGSLFLLLAMTTMVAHAQQSLNHVWPWWAFGISLGIAILIMFGLFEKRK